MTKIITATVTEFKNHHTGEKANRDDYPTPTVHVRDVPTCNVDRPKQTCLVTR